jgi:hypothetical protein
VAVSPGAVGCGADRSGIVRSEYGDAQREASSQAARDEQDRTQVPEDQPKEAIGLTGVVANHGAGHASDADPETEIEPGAHQD